MLFKERQPFCLVTVLNIVACLEMGTQDLSGRVLAVCEFLPSLLPQGGLESPLGPGLFPRVLVHSPDFPSWSLSLSVGRGMTCGKAVVRIRGDLVCRVPATPVFSLCMFGLFLPHKQL